MLFYTSASARVETEFWQWPIHSIAPSPVTSRLFQLPGNFKTVGVRFSDIILQCTWLEMLPEHLGLSSRERQGNRYKWEIVSCTRIIVSRMYQSKTDQPNYCQTLKKRKISCFSGIEGLGCSYEAHWGPKFSLVLWFRQVMHCIYCWYSWYLEVGGPV